MKKVIFVFLIILILCVCGTLYGARADKYRPYSQVVHSSSEYEKYWNFLNKKIYPVPVTPDNDPLALLDPAVFRRLGDAEKSLIIADLKTKISNLRADKTSIRSTASLKVGKYSLCFVMTRNGEPGSAGDFSMYHELVHCEVRASEDGAGINFYLGDQHEFYSNVILAITPYVDHKTSMKSLTDKYIADYAKNMDESYADIVSLSYLYFQGKGDDDFEKAIALRNREFCRTGDFTHWTAPSLVAAKEFIEKGQLSSKFNGDYRKMAMNIIQTMQKKDVIFNYVNNNSFMGHDINNVCK